MFGFFTKTGNVISSAVSAQSELKSPVDAIADKIAKVSANIAEVSPGIKESLNFEATKDLLVAVKNEISSSVLNKVQATNDVFFPTLKPTPLFQSNFIPPQYKSFDDESIGSNKKYESVKTQTFESIRPEIFAVFSYESPFQDENGQSFSSIGKYEYAQAALNEKYKEKITEALKSDSQRSKTVFDKNKKYAAELKSISDYISYIAQASRKAEKSLNFNEYNKDAFSNFEKFYSAKISSDTRKISSLKNKKTSKNKNNTSNENYIFSLYDIKSYLLNRTIGDEYPSKIFSVYPIIERSAITDLKDIEGISASNNISSFLSFVEKKLSTDSDEKIYQLSNILYKEIVFSLALSDNKKTSKFSKYGASQNVDMWDQIIGVTDISDPYKIIENSNSFSSISINATSGFPESTFDSVFVTKQSNQFTPGRVSKIRKCFEIKNGEYQTSQIYDFAIRLESYSKDLSELAFDFNIHSSFFPELDYTNYQYSSPQRVLDKVSSLIYKNFTDMNKELDTSSITEKNVFYKALCKAKNSYEKSKIYTYILYRIFGGSDAKVMNYLENQIAKYFVSNQQNGFSNFSLANNQLNKNSDKSRTPENVEEIITEAKIIALLKTKSDFFSSLTSLIQEFSLILNANQKILNPNNKTRFGGFNETHMLSFVLELLYEICKKTNTSFSLSGFYSSSGLFATDIKTSNSSYAKKIEPLKNLMSSREDEFILKYFEIVAFLSDCANSSREFAEVLDKKDAKNGLNQLRQIFHDDDFPKLMSEGQRRLLEKSSLDISDILSDQDPYKFVIGTDQTLDQKWCDIVQKYLRDKRFSPKSTSNAKIFCVGIPEGTSESIELSSNLTEVEQDIITVEIYKTDETRPGLVFKPVFKKYEMSRFVSENSNNHSIDNFEFIDTTQDVAKFEKYSNSKQEQEILDNHIESKILEKHISFTTALRISDFSIVESPSKIATIENPVNDFDNNLLIAISKPQTPAKVSADTSSRIKEKFSNIQQQISKSTDIIKSVMKTSEIVQSLAPSIVSSGDINPYLKNYGIRRYDRVMFMLIDPDNFEIDIEQTIKNGNEDLIKYLKTNNELVSKEGKVFLTERLVDREDVALENYTIVVSI